MGGDEKLERALAGFLRDFPSLEHAREDLGRLSRAAVKNSAKGADGHWYYIARDLFGSTDERPRRRWYADTLPNLAFRAGWFKTLDEAKRLADEVQEVVRASMRKKLRVVRTTTETEVMAAFKKEFGSLEEARKDLGRLGHIAVARGGGHPWFNASITLFRDPNGAYAKWYEDILPKLVWGTGWFASMEEAKAFSEEVRIRCAKTGKEKSSASRRSMSEAEVVEAFKAEFGSLENARGDLGRLTNNGVLASATGVKGHWCYSASSIFKGKNGSRGKWYEDVLPKLTLGAGWFASMEEAKAFSEEVRTFGHALRKKKMSKRAMERGRDKNDVVAAFKKEFGSLEEARKDLGRLTNRSIIKNAKGARGHWYHAAHASFKRPDGKPGRLYEDILPNLAFEAGWFKTLEKAKLFADEIRAFSDTAKRNKLRALRKMTEVEVMAAFKKEFGSLEEARKDLGRLGCAAVAKSARGVAGHWFYASVSWFRKPDGKYGNWYKHVLPNLALKAGWFKTLEEARLFSEEVRKHADKACKERRAETIYNQGKQAQAPSKASRNYAIVVATLKGATGASFHGVSRLLSMGASEATVANEPDGMPRAVVLEGQASGKQLTAGELVRLKMRTESWGGEIADAYASAFPCIAPYLTVRLLMLHALRLSKEGKLPELLEGASLMSGPGEVHGALQELKDEIERSGMQLPKVIDVDSEPDMLRKSGNPSRVLAKLPHTPLAPASLDFVECSSLYQFNQWKQPTIVKETLAEAGRVLKEGGAILLTSTAKRFSASFEEGLRRLGFDIVMPANTRLELSENAAEEIRGRMGDEVLRKALDATRETYYLIAVKAAGEGGDAPAEVFSFEKQQSRLPEEARALARQARRFGRDLDESTGAAEENMGRMLRMLDGLEPEAHLKNARLIQTILSRYMLDPKIAKPDGEGAQLIENSGRLAEGMGWARDSTDRYFALLRRAAITHKNKLDASMKKAEPTGPIPKG